MSFSYNVFVKVHECISWCVRLLLAVIKKLKKLKHQHGCKYKICVKMMFINFFENGRNIIVKSALQRISRPNVVDRYLAVQIRHDVAHYRLSFLGSCVAHVPSHVDGPRRLLLASVCYCKYNEGLILACLSFLLVFYIFLAYFVLV